MEVMNLQEFAIAWLAEAKKTDECEPTIEVAILSLLTCMTKHQGNEAEAVQSVWSVVEQIFQAYCAYRREEGKL